MSILSIRRTSTHTSGSWKVLPVFLVAAASLVVGTFTGVEQAQALTYSRTTPQSASATLLCGSTATSGNSIFVAGVTIAGDTGSRLFVLAGDSVTISAPALTGSCALSGLSAPQFIPNQDMPAGEGVLWRMKNSSGTVINLAKNVDAYSSLPITIEFLKADGGTLSWDFAFVTTANQKVNSSVNIWNGILDEQPQAPTNISTGTHNPSTQEVSVTIGTPSIPVGGYQYRIYPSGGTVTSFLPAESSKWQDIENFNGVTLPQLSNGTVKVPSGSLSAGSYVLELRAVKQVQPNTQQPTRSIWDMSSSVTTNFTVAGKPGVPTSVVATPGNGKVTLTWAAPTSDGGSPITEYRMRALAGGQLVRHSASSPLCVVTAPTTTCTYTSLTNEVEHTFEIAAVNAVNSASNFLSTSFDRAQVKATPSASIQDSTNNSGTSGGATTGGSVTPTPSTGSGTGGTTSGDSSSTSGATTTTVANVSTTSGATPTLVTTSEVAALTQRPGAAGAIIDGRVTQVDVTQLVADGISVEPSKRTTAQIDAIRKAAHALIKSFNTASRTATGVTVKNTSTGAVIVGLVSASGSTTSTPVPAEKVVLVSTSGGTIMMAGIDSAGKVLPLAKNGAVVLPAKGSLAFALGGFAANSKGEVVLAKSGKVVSTFSATSEGLAKFTVARTDSMSAGNHTLVIAAGSTRIGVGLSVASAVTELPQTGGDIPLTSAMFLLLMGLVLVLVARRDHHATQ